MTSFHKEQIASVVTATDSMSKGELLAKRDELYELRRSLKGTDLAPLVRTMIRIIDEEILYRATLVQQKAG